MTQNRSVSPSTHAGTETVNQADTPLKNFFPEPSPATPTRLSRRRRSRSRRLSHCPPQHQNPIELIATVAEWKDDKLIVHEGTQNAEAIRHGLATALGLPPEHVEVISPFAGGGFGQKNSLQMQTVLAAVAARVSAAR